MSVKEYLETLKWDGKPRIATFFDDYATGANDFDATKWFVSAVARAMTPGCRVDQILALCGPQGAGKSKLLSTLFGDKNKYVLLNRLALETLSTKWIVEFNPEYLRSGYNKLFFWQTADTYIPTCQSLESVTRPRSCLFVATSSFPLDVSGSRRLWVVNITACAASKIAADRDQLWAEAKHCFDNGVQWWD